MKNKESKEVVVIPKSEAIFWLDKKGDWRNESGRFQNSRINSHFHSSIHWDDEDYFLSQEHSQYLEKVYFPYEDTALFVTNVNLDLDHPILTLNTGEHLSLVPENLFIWNDQLYLHKDKHRIKFKENALLQISRLMSFQNDHVSIEIKGKHYNIASY